MGGLELRWSKSWKSVWIQYRYCFSVCVCFLFCCSSSSLLSRPVIALRRLRPEMRILLNLALGKIRRRRRERESGVVWKRQQQHFLWQYPARTRVKDWGKGGGMDTAPVDEKGTKWRISFVRILFYCWVLSQGGEREDRKGVSIGIINPLSASLSLCILITAIIIVIILI